MLRPPKRKLESFVQRYSFKFRALEPGINLEREFDEVRKKGHLEQQCRQSRGRIKKMYSKKRYRKKMYKKKVYARREVSLSV